MAEPPSGTVTFLFTDIEGSTRSWERSPVAMRTALARHNALVNAAVDRFGGYVFKTIGDAFCVAFESAADAVAAACAAQAMLADERWPQGIRIDVRMALHTGAAEPQDNDYFGQPLNRVARLLGAGHGGQVLVSHATQELVRDSLPPGVRLRDMGERRLKDLIGAERVYQLIAPAFAADFPPLKTLDARAHNLPVQSTSFVGREREIQQVRKHLEACRLVTLTGAGGAGKTRLSLQVAAELIDEYEDGVWFVELAPLSDARLVPQAAATVLGVKMADAGDPTATLANELGNRQLLLMLDNCEHLVHACALLCQALLSNCPRLRVLCSSREALRIPGETLYRVPSLDIPAPATEISVEALNRFAAARLFIDRAVTVRPGFQVNGKTAPAVASICRQLDGIPLAIELAAARLRSLSVDDIDRRLDQRFRVLTVGVRTALPRQQTLRALIDWSYDLLNGPERALFCRLAVFAGSSSLDAAETVCDGVGVSREEIVDLVTSLVDKSLLIADERKAVVRYRLLETMRQYALERLRETSDQDRWQQRHFAYYLSLAEQAESHLTAADQDAWLDRLDDEKDNVRSALAWASSSAATVSRGIDLAAAFWRFWYMRGMLGEGRATLSELLARPSAQNVDASRAKALSGAGVMAAQQGDYAAAKPLYEQSLAIRRQIGDRLGIASSLGNLANLAAEQGDFPRARRLHEESLAIRRELGDRWGIALSLGNLGLAALEQGDYATARARGEESLALRRELGDLWGTAISLSNLGRVALDVGDHAAARKLLDESLTIRRELDDRLGIADSLYILGNIACAQRDFAFARSVAEQSLAIFRDLRERSGIANSLAVLGRVALDTGDYALALDLQAQGLAIRRELGDRRGIAMSLENLAQVFFALGDPIGAIRAWSRARKLRDDIGSPLPPGERLRYDEQFAAARTAVGDVTTFDKAREEGVAMTLDDAIACALRAGERSRATP